MVSIQTVENKWGTKSTVFSVPLPSKPPVFMSVKAAPYNNDKRGVVIVDAEKFLQLWKNEPYSIHHKQSHGNPQTWPSDYKYARAETGFSYGVENPVPLAYVSYGEETRTIVTHKFLWFGRQEYQEKFSYLGFTDGVTRTIWLLTHGCSAFPIECEMPGARELHRVAAVPGTQFFTVGELAKAMLHA